MSNNYTTIPNTPHYPTRGIKQSTAHANAGVYILAGKHNVAVILADFPRHNLKKKLTCVSWWHLFSQLIHWQTRGINQSPAHANAGVYILAGKHNMAVIQAVFQRKNLKRNDMCLVVTFVFSTISMTDQWDQAKPSSCLCRGVYSSRKTQCGCDPGSFSKKESQKKWHVSHGDICFLNYFNDGPVGSSKAQLMPMQGCIF